MTTNDMSKPLTRNYDSDKEKSEIDSDIRVLKIRQRLAAHSGRRNCILQQEYPSDPLRKISALQTKVELARNLSDKQNLA